MAFLGESFSTDTLPKSTASDPIPAGWYSASITEASVQSTKAGTGEYIKLRYDITGPSYQGRVVFGNLNIRNPNPKAEEIGRQQLGELMRSIGLSQVSDSDQLIGGSCMIKVAIREDASGQYAPQNEVKAWNALGGSKPPVPRPAVASAPAPSANASAAPPWARK